MCSYKLFAEQLLFHVSGPPFGVSHEIWSQDEGHEKYGKLFNLQYGSHFEKSSCAMLFVHWHVYKVF